MPRKVQERPKSTLAAMSLEGTMPMVRPMASCLVSRGQFTTIDIPGATRTVANGINARGDIVGRYDIAGVGHGFLLSEDELTTIDSPGATLTAATAINPRRDIVGHYRSVDGKEHGFLLGKLS